MTRARTCSCPAATRSSSPSTPRSSRTRACSSDRRRLTLALPDGGTGPQFPPRVSAPREMRRRHRRFPGGLHAVFHGSHVDHARVPSRLSMYWAPRSGISRCGGPAVLSFRNAIWFARRELPLVQDAGPVPACGEWGDGHRGVRRRDCAPNGLPAALAGNLCLRLGVKDWQVAGLARSLAGTGTAVAWRAEQ